MQSSETRGSAIKRVWQSLLDLATNKFFIAGLLGLFVLMALGYLLIDRMLMPSYVGYNVSVTVPDVKEMPIEEARVLLEDMDLQTEVESGRYNPQLPRNVVVDQNPQPNMYVKPGRRIYLTINTGATPEVTVPSLEGISLTQAQNLLFAAGLKAEKSDIRPDPIPHQVSNIVTRQDPVPGAIVKEGDRVRIWYSTGLGNEYATVPEVTGLTAREAQRELLSLKLRSLVLGAGDYPDPQSLIVNSQSHTAGTRLKEGSEIRLFVEIPSEEEETTGQ